MNRRWGIEPTLGLVDDLFCLQSHIQKDFYCAPTLWQLIIAYLVGLCCRNVTAFSDLSIFSFKTRHLTHYVTNMLRLEWYVDISAVLLEDPWNPARTQTLLLQWYKHPEKRFASSIYALIPAGRVNKLKEKCPIWIRWWMEGLCRESWKWLNFLRDRWTSAGSALKPDEVDNKIIPSQSWHTALFYGLCLVLVSVFIWSFLLVI